MEYFYIVSEQVLMYVVYGLIGVAAMRSGTFDQQDLGVLSRFVLRIAMPIMIFIYALNGASREQFIASLPILLASLVLFALLFLLSNIPVRLFGVTGNERNVFRAASMFGNVGFMGIPILIALFPQEGMLYVALYSIVDQLLLWTVGLYLTSPVNRVAHLSLRDTLRMMVNPASIAIVLAIIGILLQVKLPGFINTALMKTGALTTPLALIYLGGVFSSLHFSDYLKQWEIYGVVLLKMILVPVIFFHVVQWLPGISLNVAVALSIIAGMPSMIAVTMLAKSQESAGDYAAGIVFITTVASVITLPFICYLIALMR